MNKVADIKSRPNRRTNQRRQGKADRRQSAIWVNNCRRSGQVDRRYRADRRPDPTGQWQTFKTVKPLARRFCLPTEEATIGQRINISV